MNNSNEYTMQKVDILAIIRLNIKKSYLLFKRQPDTIILTILIFSYLVI